MYTAMYNGNVFYPHILRHYGIENENYSWIRYVREREGRKRNRGKVEGGRKSESSSPYRQNI